MRGYLLTVLLLFPSLGIAQRHIAGSIRAYGDSITYGIAASNVGTTDYVSLLGAHYSALTVNHGMQGDTSCDLTSKVFAGENPTAPVGGIYTMMIGTNDANNQGAGAYEAVYRACHLASLSWMAVVRSSKVFAQDSGCSKSGTWTADDSYQVGLGEQSSATGAAMACSITTQGNPVYIWYRIINGNAGTFTYSLDGGTSVAANSFTTPAIAANSVTDSIGLIRIPDVAAGEHTVSFVVTSGSGKVSISAVGSPPITGYAGQPLVFAAGVPFQEGDNLSATTSAYNADALADAALVAGDGGAVHFVDVRAFWCTNCAEVSGDMANGLHPNDLGMSEIAEGFESVIDLYFPEIPTSPSTHTNGNHNGHYN